MKHNKDHLIFNSYGCFSLLFLLILDFHFFKLQKYLREWFNSISVITFIFIRSTFSFFFFFCNTIRKSQTRTKKKTLNKSNKNPLPKSTMMQEKRMNERTHLIKFPAEFEYIVIRVWLCFKVWSRGWLKYVLCMYKYDVYASCLEWNLSKKCLTFIR